jgi:sarcosine oxidase
MTQAKNSFDYIVIGLGGLGSAAAYWLSREAGREVLGVERFELGHERGESEDHSRIIRLTYHNIQYIRFAQASYRTWTEMEEDAGERFVIKTGELNFWPAETTLSEESYNTSMAACGVPFERLDARDIRRRFPQFRFADDIRAIYQPDGGLVAASRANAAHRRMARRNGATLLGNMPVTAIRQSGAGYRVTAGGREFEAGKLVIAAGPWTNDALKHLDVHLPLRVTQEQVTYFASPHLEEFAPDRFPVWIWMILDNFYGFPVYGANGVKAARDRFAPVDPDRRSFIADARNEQDVSAFLERHIPRAHGPVLYSKTCLLTHTPDADFVLDTVPGHPGVSCAVGATHAFKFASVIGKTLGELLKTGRASEDISLFRFDRPSMRPDTVQSFLIEGLGEHQAIS